MDLFPEVTSEPIRVGSVYKSPYQWAADIAPEGQLLIYKDALMWMQGEEFGSLDGLKLQAKKAVAFLADERGVNVDLSAPFYQKKEPEPTPIAIAPTVVAATPQPAATEDGGWSTVSKPTKQPKANREQLTVPLFATMVFDACLTELKRVYSFTGPSLRFSDVDERYKSLNMKYPTFISALRQEIAKRGQPTTYLGQATKGSRFWAESSPGKGKNFNFKVQYPDKKKPNGWSASAQIHVLWE